MNNDTVSNGMNNKHKQWYYIMKVVWVYIWMSISWWEIFCYSIYTTFIIYYELLKCVYMKYYLVIFALLFIVRWCHWLWHMSVALTLTAMLRQCCWQWLGVYYWLWPMTLCDCRVSCDELCASILVTGPPGCGKAAVVRSVAGQLNMHVLSVSDITVTILLQSWPCLFFRLISFYICMYA